MPAEFNITSRIAEPSYAQRFLRRKKIVETDAWSDLSTHEHAHAFTVAHSVKAGILNDTLGMLKEAQKNGTSYEKFKTQYLDLMQEKGWYGKKSGEKTGSDYQQWRTKNIYKTNMHTAANAGSYRQQLKTAKERPHLVYKSVLYGKNRREHHKGMHNVSYPVGHSFWNEAYPPNGWGCECYVVSVDDEELIEYGIEKENGVKAEALKPDEYWKGNVGLDALVPRFGDMPYLAENKDVMEKIVKAYAKDMNNAALTRGEFAKLASKLSNYSGKIKPRIPVTLATMNDGVWEAVKKVDKNIDVKLHATTFNLMHAVRPSKINPVPSKYLEKVWDVMRDPDIVYAEKTELLFFKEIEKEKYIRIAFAHEKQKALRMRSFSYFDDNQVWKQVRTKKGKVYEKRQ